MLPGLALWKSVVVDARPQSIGPPILLDTRLFKLQQELITNISLGRVVAPEAWAWGPPHPEPIEGECGGADAVVVVGGGGGVHVSCISHGVYVAGAPSGQLLG